MRSNVLFVLIATAMLLFMGSASGTIWHVHPDSAITTIQAGIDSSTSGDTVLVYPETYVENINFNGENVVLGSLFLTTRDTTYISSTVIDGGSSGSVVALENGEDSTGVITGFTIQNGYAEYGGGIYCDSSSLSLSNVILTGNTAEYGGGGISCYYSSDPSLTNVTINANIANYGGGISCRHNSDPSLINVTISGNTVYYGGGIHCYYNSNPTLVNCILWNDTPQEICFSGSGSANTVTISYSDIQGDSAGIVTNDNGTIFWLEGNIDADPSFVGSGGHPFALQQASPCIDAGTPDTAGLGLPPWDILGCCRIWDGDGNGSAVVDMGAYEYGAPAVGIEERVVMDPPPSLVLQNFPNPFRDRTNIRLSLPSHKHVCLKIYDSVGRLVKTLVDEKRSAVQYTVRWDGRDATGMKVPSGIYFYRIETEEYTATKKMVVVR